VRGTFYEYSSYRNKQSCNNGPTSTLFLRHDLNEGKPGNISESPVGHRGALWQLRTTSSVYAQFTTLGHFSIVASTAVIC
jgi:hypothetical protein